MMNTAIDTAMAAMMIAGMATTATIFTTRRIRDGTARLRAWYRAAGKCRRP